VFAGETVVDESVDGVVPLAAVLAHAVRLHDLLEIVVAVDEAVGVDDRMLREVAEDAGVVGPDRGARGQVVASPQRALVERVVPAIGAAEGLATQVVGAVDNQQ